MKVWNRNKLDQIKGINKSKQRRLLMKVLNKQMKKIRKIKLVKKNR